MASINAILRYDTGKKKFSPANVFTCRKYWDIPELSEVFYGTIAIMTDFMAARGAIPGMLAMCPTIVPIGGAWLMGSVVRRLSENPDDIRASVFLDENNYRSVMDYSGIDRVVIVVDGDKADCTKVLPELRGWKPEGEPVEIYPGMHLVELGKCSMDAPSEDMIDAEIRRMELEANQPGEDDLTPESRKELDRLIDTLEKTWELFGKYDYDMMKFLANTDEAEASGEFAIGDDDDSIGMDSVSDDYRQELTQDTYAPLSMVKLLADTVNNMADFNMKLHKAIIKDTVQNMKLSEQMTDLDGLMTDALKAVKEQLEAARDMQEEKMSGIRHQIALLVMQERKRKYMAVASMVVSGIALLISLLTV